MADIYETLQINGCAECRIINFGQIENDVCQPGTNLQKFPFKYVMFVQVHTTIEC